ncbi:UPF0764 protein C16orf89 homolog [Glandiceps talaboti]
MPPTFSLCVIVLMVVLAVTGSTDLATDEEYDDYLVQVLDALDKAVSYLGNEYTEVNADVVLGVRMAEGQLKVLLDRMVNFELLPPVDRDTLQRIQASYDKLTFLGDVTTPQLLKSDPDQLMHLGKMLRRGFWDIYAPTRKVDENLAMDHIVSGEFLNEDATDDCIEELLGTSDDSIKPCDVSDTCVKLMTTPGFRLYTLSHQVLYLEIAQQAGCADEIERRLQENGVLVDPNLMMETFCTNMLNEAIEFANAGYPSKGQDLFMEQGLLCGLDGYREFFRSEWLQSILTWQDPTGCFKSDSMSAFAHKDNTSTPQQESVKRREKILDDGCSSHKTSVAVGILSGYVRYILEAMI